jgi:hypothetical protein
MEQIAMRYLGDPQRWLEIATLNDLREPYLDQNGFQYPLLSNADGRNIVVGNNDDLFIGQSIFLFANGQIPTARNITNIVTLSTTSFLITLDGLANLDIFTTAGQAYLQGYLPGTVNSMNSIWIPSDQQAPPFDQISIPASVANVKLVGISKCDWLVNTSTGDLVIDSSGDFQLAAGINNLIQALSFKFSCTLGTCLLEPTFGLPFKVGSSIADFNAKTTYNQISSMITADPRFSGVSGLQVTQNGPSLGITLGVQLSGQTGLFPVSFSLPYSSPT